MALLTQHSVAVRKCIMSLIKALDKGYFFIRETILTTRDVVMFLLMLAYLLIVVRTSL